jgi:hypothetical protein
MVSTNKYGNVKRTLNTSIFLFLHVEKNIYIQVAVGGADKILQPLSNKIDTLHEAIASMVAASKDTDSEEEHVFGNFHSSRIIR